MKNQSSYLNFNDFCLSITNGGLMRNGHSLTLTPKAFEVLAYLCSHPGRLITKDELLDAVWRTRFVSEGVLKNAVQELRKILGDDPKAPRYIETVHRRGYRFIADVHSMADGNLSAGQPPAASRNECLVGRDTLLARLEQALQSASFGRVGTVFLSGEPGIGKTTLIQAFMRECATRALTVQGQCVEQYGQGEPYLPLLEAINQIVREGGGEYYRLLRRYAPTWLLQLPWLSETSDREGLLREAHGATKDRMLRELGEFVIGATSIKPLVLAVEDIHWSDRATLDAVNYLARRKDAVRLLVLGSYRPADVAKHPFSAMRDELLLHALCDDLSLDLLSAEEVAAYLQHRFSGDCLPDAVLQGAFKRTEGLPLFLVRVADEMEATDSNDYERALARIPEGLARLIELQFRRLSDAEKNWLEIAAVCGDGFSAGTLAAVSSALPTDVEHWCEQAVRANFMLKYADLSEQPFGGRGYAFAHAYYQECLYESIAPNRKAGLHHRVAKHLETDADRPNHHAAELAEHFDRGGQFDKAAQYFYQAALNALERHAAHEAVISLQAGLDRLDRYFPVTADYEQRRLQYLNLLPPVLIAVKGYAAPELESLYRRALELTTRLEIVEDYFFLLYGKWMFHLARAELDVALALAEQLAYRADNSAQAAQKMVSCLALGTNLLFIGKHRQADACFEAGKSHAETLGLHCSDLTKVLGQEPLSTLLALQAITAQTLGDIERAELLMQSAQQRADAYEHPYTKTYILFCMVWLFRDAGDPYRVREWLPVFERLAVMHGFPVMVNTVSVFKGWVAAVLDSDHVGIERIEQSIEILGVYGTRLTKTMYYYQLADACSSLGKYQDSLRANELALSEAEFGNERRYESSVWRQRGELLHYLGDRNHETAEVCFEQALTIARNQGTKLLALRAACSQFKFARPDRKAIAEQVLLDTYSQFSDGFETPYLLEAKSLLGLE